MGVIGAGTLIHFSEQKCGLTERDELGMSGLGVETAEVSKSIGDTHKPTFKKRGFKGKIRSSSGPEVKVEEGDEGDVDKQKLNDLRLVRELKKRKSGTDVVRGLNKAAKVVKGAGDGGGEVGESLEVSGISATMKSQFSSNRRMYDDPIGTIAHRDIMERYVEEKLGLVNGEGDQGASTASSGDRKQGPLQEEDNEQAGFYTGIAEVELDESYKLKNIQETEKSLMEMAARRKARDREQGPELGYGGRFHKPKSRADYVEEERRQAEESAPAPSVALPPAQRGAGGEAIEDRVHHDLGDRRHQKRAGAGQNDTRMLKNFQARQKY